MIDKDLPSGKIEEFASMSGNSMPEDEFQAAILLEKSGLFDSDYYLTQIGADLRQDPILHYLRQGSKKGLNPAPWFDVRHYLSAYPDIGVAGVDPFIHYLIHGHSEGRSPNSNIAPAIPATAENPTCRAIPTSLEQYSSHEFWLCGYKFKAVYYRYMEQMGQTAENNVVLITDENYAMAAIVAAHSFIVSASQPLNLYLIAVGDCVYEIAERARRLLGKGANIHIIGLNNPLDFVEVAEKYITVAGLYKFAIPDILYDKASCLYVDADVLAFCGWDHIFAYELEDSALGAIRDYVGVYDHRLNEHLDTADYFNSGVLLMDLVQIRSNNFSQQCIRMKLDDKEGKYRFQDQDIFNAVYDGKWLPLAPVYNYMLNFSYLEGSFTDNFNVRVKPEEIRILHYSWLKPWLTREALSSEFWHDEYRRLFGKAHALAPYRESEFSEGRQNEYYRLAMVRPKSVLCLETLHCHGEVMPGFIKYFQDKGYNVDLVWHFDLDKLDSIALLDQTRLRRYRNWNFSPKELLTPEKLDQYEMIFISSRTCYPGNPDGSFPNIYEVHPWLNAYKYKIVNMEHHLEAITSPHPDNYVVLANPGNKRHMQSHIVNFPHFGNVRVKLEKGSPVRFIVVGSIEQHRKNFQLLLSSLKSLNWDYHVDIIAMRNQLDIPKELEKRITFHQALPFRDMYRKMEESDFILALLDPDIREHARYLKSATSGTFQLAYGFRKPCIIHEAYAETFLFNDQNSLVYRSNNEFPRALWKAVFMDPEAYTERVQHMEALYQQVMASSTQNMDNLLRSLNLLIN